MMQLKTISRLALAMATTALISCGGSTGITKDEATPASNDSTQNSSNMSANNLSASEKDAGWALLFNGQSLDGWRTYQKKSSDSWTVVNGELHCKGSASDKSDLRADLVTNDQYQDFDLSVDWKISAQGNSGILYLVSEAEKTSYMTGPEYQLIDDANFPEKLEDWQKTGANYAMNTAPTAKPNAVGEWNTTRILVNKGHVEHWLNGQKIVEYEMGSDEWKKNKAEGKWKDTPAYGTVKKGHIALQDHGSEAWFRNIKIKQL
jgi:hypothetical protein